MVPVQAKLAVNQPGDTHEQQADRFADTALHPDGRQETASIGPPTLEAVKSSQLAVDGESLQGSGQALPEYDRHFFESRLGHNLGDVRIHTDAQAARAAQTLSAQAFTHGRDVYFGAGKFQPHAAEGRRLLAHELAHTVQQAAGGSGPRVMRKPLPGENAAAYKRRQEIIDDAKATIQTLEHCLAKKIPCGDETLTPTGDFKINGWGGVAVMESAATHDGRLNQLVTDLKDIEHQLESAPPSAGALSDVKHPEGNGMQIFSGSDLDNMYVNYALAHGLTYKIATLNALYIDHVVEKKNQPKPAPTKPKKKPPPPAKKTVPPVTKPAKTEDAEPPRHFEEKTPYTIVVPDPQNAPLVYHLLQSGFDDNRGHILDVFRDEKGHFYRGYHDQKVYLPHWHDPY
ncbi:MAG TPA: DUF4157 domain-containing protein [Opitutaceae bacterium]|jgi:hypothetical protein|nr:DUF4157 domain-containing protein [Opitutaceae bacterium]